MIDAETLTGPFDPGGQPDTRSGNALELGLFAWNIKGGMTASKAVLSDPERLQNYWHWDSAKHLVQMAERIGFEYEVPFARWIGQGGASDYNGASLDFLSSAAALAPVTQKLGIFSTAHVTYKFHPLHFAKFGSTIDFISGGRWGLNIVSGYAAREMAAFGMKEPIEHDTAYEMADEFTTLLKYYWHYDEKINYEGRFYQSYGGTVGPKPLSRPRPVIMNAGNSDVGLDFACRQADWVFITGNSLEDYAEKVSKVNRLSAKYGRDVRCSTMVWILVEPTDEQAEEKRQWLEDEVDREAVLNFIQSAKNQSTSDEYGKGEDEDDPWGGMGRENFLRIAFGLTAWQMVGSPQTVAEKLRELQAVGLESMLTCFVDPLKGLHAMEDYILPDLRKMGLRK